MDLDVPGDDGYGAALAVATIFVGAYLAESEKNANRAERMRVALEDQLAAYHEGFPDAEPADRATPDVLKLVPSDYAPALAKTLLIDLYFVRPFSPAELRFDNDQRDSALALVARHMGLSSDTGKHIRETARSAERAHRERPGIGKIALFGGGAMLVAAMTAGAAAPLIAGAIGTAAGLSGAAALAHGMAVLGLGSLATGGLGMAGGMWIVTGTGALVGAVGGSSAAALVQLGAPAARRELVKLQTTTVEVGFRYWNKPQITEVVSQLLVDRDEVRVERARASLRNDDDAAVIKQLEDVEDALGDAIGWINARLERA